MNSLQGYYLLIYMFIILNMWYILNIKLCLVGDIMKFSKQRELILNTIIENNIHPTADFIYQHLKNENPNLSLGTVYRNLAQLVDHGFIRKVSIPGYPDRFDGYLKDHHHLICEKCREVYDIESYTLNNLDSIVSKETGLEITSSNISFKGICNNCKSLNNKNIKKEES